MAKKQDDGKDNIRKKLAADGGSQPSKVEIIKLYKDFNSKFEYLVRVFNEKYQINPVFYIQRHEFNMLRDIIWKDCVWCVNAPTFEYNGKNYNAIPFNLQNKHPEMNRINRIFVFHTVSRSDGELLIHGTYV